MTEVLFCVFVLTSLLSRVSATTFPRTTPLTTILPTTTQTTTPITTPIRSTTTPQPTTPMDGCVYDGVFYANGEDIEKDENNCFGMFCDYGGIVAWDHQCFFYTPYCSGVSERVPGECCPVCHNATTIPTTIPPTTTPPGGCMYEGKFYRNGEEIYRDKNNCGGAHCRDGGIDHWDDICMFYTPVCYGKSKPVDGQCCPLCLNMTTSTPPTSTPSTSTPPSSTPQIPGCHVDGKFYAHGQQVEIDPKNCSGSVCQYGVVHSWEKQCAYIPYLCPGKWMSFPDQCCLVCVTTPAPETTTPEAVCNIRNKKYFVGQRSNTDPCHICRCTANGTESCLDISCEYVSDCDVKYKLPGECCYTCGCSRVFASIFTMLLLLFLSEGFQPI